MNNKFSENIKKIRKDNHLSQEELAEQLGVSRQAISKWESSVAYPEMDKIIQICDKFGVNIDDLLHKDIKEVKGEEETKNKLNKYMDDFFDFITDTVRLIENMNFKSKVKCLFEQIGLAIFLFLAFGLVYLIGEGIIYNIFYLILPHKAAYIISSVLWNIYLIFALISGTIIMTHIFNIRYLEYFKVIKNNNEKNHQTKERKNIENDENAAENQIKETNNLSINEKNKIEFKKDKEKIIIRDPNHSEYHFLNGIAKLILWGIKFCAFWCELGLCISLVCIVAATVASFLIVKTGIFFIGVLIGLIAMVVLNVVLILLLFNFMFNRKNNKKLIIWSSIASIIVIGISCGLIALGLLEFNIEMYSENTSVTKSIEVLMSDDMYLDDYMDMHRVEYIEENRTNLRIEYDTYEEYELNYYVTGYGNLHIWAESRNPIEDIKKIIEDINNKKIISYRTYPTNAKVRVYTSKENIEKLKVNQKARYDLERQIELENERYEAREEELEEALNEAYLKIDRLEEKLDEYKSLIEIYNDNE